MSFTPAPGHHGPWVQQQRKTRARPRATTSPPPTASGLRERYPHVIGAPRYRPGRTIVPATKGRFTNNLPDLSQLLCVPINTNELDKMTSNMGTIFSNTLETVAPIKLKKVREKRAAPWYNSYTHSLKKKTRNLERKWRKTNLEVFRIAWKNSMSSYRQALKAARTENIHKLIDNNQNNPRFLFSTVARLTNNQTSPDLNIPSV